MSFQEYYTQARIHALENTLQQVCMHLDTMQYTMNLSIPATASASTALFGEESFFSPFTYISIVLKVIFVVGIALLMLFDYLKSVIMRSKAHTVTPTIEIQATIIEDDDNSIQDKSENDDDKQDEDDTKENIGRVDDI